MEIVCNKMQLKEFAHRQVRVTFQCLLRKTKHDYDGIVVQLDITLVSKALICQVYEQHT